MNPKLVPSLPWEYQVIDCYVYQVYDGDTVKVLIDYENVLFNLSVRLLDIDTPELRSISPLEKEAACHVRDYLKMLIEGKMVKLYATGWDKFGGRMDGHIWQSQTWKEGDETISQHLIKMGYAKSFTGKEKKSPWTDEELKSMVAP
jgi:endonuclease YncB( thermonuclease family)